VFGPHKALYGTTRGGGTQNGGTIYRLAPPIAPGAVWTEQTLYRFPGYSGDGQEPAGTLVVSGNGVIYGATEFGGLDAGTIFQLTPPTIQGASWTETILYEFGGQSGDSAGPTGLVTGPSGVLYGTAIGSADAQGCPSGCGTVFQLSPPESPGGPGTETILHNFTGAATGDGSNPNSVPLIGPGGVLYGTTSGGGANFLGTIYEMLPPSSQGGNCAEATLYSFTGGADGQVPIAVTSGPDGNLYGTTSIVPAKGGATKPGTVFQLMLK
jgi:hypothetical protein